MFIFLKSYPFVGSFLANLSVKYFHFFFALQFEGIGSIYETSGIFSKLNLVSDAVCEKI